MSVLGIDLGSLRAVVAVARAKGIDVLTNEVSERSTPTMVAFDSKRRYLGEPAKSMQMSNLKNTVTCLNRFIGRSSSESDLNDDLQYWTCKSDPQSQEVTAIVTYRNQDHHFSATELMSMFLGKLKLSAQNELKSAVSDCVISVPVFYNETQRRAMLDACEIAGLNCLRLLNDTTATALCYGLTKNDQLSDIPRNVCFVDIGFSSTKVSVASFTKGNLEIKATSFLKSVGGRDFDKVLADHFTDEIRQKYSYDVASNPRSVLRLRTVCEKIKKVLSGISSTRSELETDIRDFPLEISREFFESLSESLRAQIRMCINEALVLSGIQICDIHSVEIVGGTTRIPSVKRLISELFGKEISTTLNQDEAVARGCTFQCAIESPSFKVKEFGVKDIITYPVNIFWKSEEGQTEMQLFPRQSNLPGDKPVFLQIDLPLQISAYHANEPLCQLSNFMIGSNISKNMGTSRLRLDATIDANGLFGIKKAVAMSETEEKSIGEDGNEHVRKVVRETGLNISQNIPKIGSKSIQELREAELGYALGDKYAQELDDSRNSLEEFIYDIRSRLEDQLKPYATETDHAMIKSKLAQVEDWIYAEDDHVSKQSYVDKLAELKKCTDKVIGRYKEALERPIVEQTLRESVRIILEKMGGYELSTTDYEKIQVECQKKLDWLEAQLSQQSSKPLNEDPVFSVKNINDQREQLVTSSSIIFARAQPKKPESQEVPDEHPSNSNGQDSAMDLD